MGMAPGPQARPRRPGAVAAPVSAEINPKAVIDDGFADLWRPGKVYVFDGVDAGDVTTMNERVAACYAWAERHGLAVLDEIICWAPRWRPDRGQALDLAVTACRRDRAALLVHSLGVLPAGACVPSHLGSLPWSS